jgi:hypothetical protein
MEARSRPRTDGFNWSGNLDQVNIRALYATCRSLRFTGRLALSGAQQQAEVMFIGGEPVEINGGDTNAIALWDRGTFLAEQLLPDLSGELTGDHEMRGSLLDTRPSALWAWIGEYRLSCDVEVEQPGTRALLRFQAGHAESAEVNGMPELAALAKISSWIDGEFTVRLRPLFASGAVPAGVVPAETPAHGTLGPHDFDLSRQVELIEPPLGWEADAPWRNAPRTSPGARPTPVPPTYEPEVVDELPPAPRIGEPRAKRRWLLWAAGAGVVALVGGAGLALLLRPRPTPPAPGVARVQAPPPSAETPQIPAETKTIPNPSPTEEIPKTPPAETKTDTPVKIGAVAPAAAAADRLIAKGRALLVAGHSHSALDEFRKAERLRPDDPNLPIYMQQAQGKLGKAELALTGHGSVRVDGKRIKLPKKLRLPAGPHTLDAGTGEAEQLLLARGEKRQLKVGR